MAIVYVPTPIRKLTGGQSMVEVDGTTVAQVLTEMEQRYPGTLAEICDDRQQIKSFVAVFVNGHDIRTLAKTETPVGSRDEVHIVPAIAGGRGDRVC